jgi:hypothetical protein
MRGPLVLAPEGARMMSQLDKMAATAARCSFYVVSRTIWFGLLGLLVNLILLAFLIPELVTLGNRLTGIPAVGVGASLAAVALIVEACLIVLGLGIAFPVAYLLLGKKHGVSKAIANVARDHAAPVVDYVLDRMVAGVGAAGAQQGSAAGLVARAGSGLPVWLDRLEDLPHPLHFVARLFLARVDVGGVVAAVAEEQRARSDAPLDLEAAAGTIRERLMERARERFLTPRLGWFWILLLVDLAVFATLKVAI